MSKKKYYCFACEEEYSVSYTSKEEPKFCCFCASALEDADQDIEEIQDWQLDE